MGARYVQRQLDLSVAEIAGAIRDLTLSVELHAEEGSGGSGVLTLDDPSGTLEPLPLKVVGIYEDTIDPMDANPYIWVGYAHKRTYYRGENFAGGAARTIDMEIYDLNEVLSRRHLRKSRDDTARPAETAGERFAWIFGTVIASLVDDSTTYVDTNTVAMDAVDYDNQTIMAVLEDIGAATGWNYFLTWTGDEFTEDDVVSPWGKFTVVFCDPGSTTFKSTVRLTNVKADVDDTTTFIVADARITHDPDEVYDEADMPFDGGIAYYDNPATEAAFALGGRGVTLPSINVKSLAKANARIARMMEADFNREEKRGTIEWFMDPGDMHLIKAGHAIDVKFSHLPDMADDYVQVRLLSMTISQGQDETGYRFYHCKSDFTFGDVASTTFQTVMSVDLSVGSAGFGDDDRTQHWATDVGADPYTLVVGKQYRLVATMLECLNVGTGLTYSVGPCNTEGRQYDTLDSPQLNINDGAGSATRIKEPSFGWTPGDGTARDIGVFDGISFEFGGDPGVDYDCGLPPYRPGQTFEGDWLTFDGSATDADISISADFISGFFGFHWKVHLELHERTAP